MEKGAAIEIRDVARRFGRRWALRGVSLDAAAGECLMLLGRNGSGKTTLLRVLATALRPTRGSGRVYGHDLVLQANAIRGLLAYLGHAPGLYGDLTGRENLRFAARMLHPHGVRGTEQRIGSILERVGLAHDADSPARGYSAGMKRRLALGRVLLTEPRLLLMDEPYASLDAAGMALIDEVVIAVRDAGGCVVVATHDPQRSGRVATRVLELRDGRLVADAPAAAASLTNAALADGPEVYA